MLTIELMISTVLIDDSARVRVVIRFFFNATPATAIYTLSLHDALPIFSNAALITAGPWNGTQYFSIKRFRKYCVPFQGPDRKSTRLNSSHSSISYAVFCLKKKKKIDFVPASPSGVNRAVSSTEFRRAVA